MPSRRRNSRKLRIITWVVLCCVFTLFVLWVRAEREHNRFIANIRALATISERIVTHAMASNHVYSDPSELLWAAIDDPNLDPIGPAYSYLAQGRDVWGHLLIPELRPECLVVIRSIGADGIDDLGDGDDMSYSVTLPSYACHSEAETK